MRVHVDEAGKKEPAGKLEDADPLARRTGERIRGAWSHTRDHAAFDNDVDLAVELARRVDRTNATEDQGLEAVGHRRPT
jgi:hypothetical protein